MEPVCEKPSKDTYKPKSQILLFRPIIKYYHFINGLVEIFTAVRVIFQFEEMVTKKIDFEVLLACVGFQCVC